MQCSILVIAYYVCPYFATLCYFAFAVLYNTTFHRKISIMLYYIAFAYAILCLFKYYNILHYSMCSTALLCLNSSISEYVEIDSICKVMSMFTCMCLYETYTYIYTDKLYTYIYICIYIYTCHTHTHM